MINWPSVDISIRAEITPPLPRAFPGDLIATYNFDFGGSLRRATARLLFPSTYRRNNSVRITRITAIAIRTVA
jgi:hypothetical protein